MQNPNKNSRQMFYSIAYDRADPINSKIMKRFNGLKWLENAYTTYPLKSKVFQHPLASPRFSAGLHDLCLKVDAVLVEVMSPEKLFDALTYY